MRRISAWAMSTLTVLVLLFSYNTSRSSQPAAASAQSLGAASNAQAGSSAQSGTGSSAAGSTAQTYTGDEAMTRYGVVQVRITVSGGKITKSEVLQVPWSDGHDQMINSMAVPVYNEEAVRSQSAGIDVVSGATVTWQGYTESLQSAIDQAHL
jgi:uncharacterized protein with FMN-binding domain